MSEEQEPSQKRFCPEHKILVPERPCNESGTTMGKSYPAMFGTNRIVFKSEEPNYEKLSHIIVSENSSNVGPDPINEGEQKLMFRGIVTVSDTDVTVDLESGVLLISGNDIGIRCKVPNETHLVRAKQLQNHLLKMMTLVKTRPVFSPEVRPAGSGESDCGDEDVPVDQEIPQVFSDKDIGAIQMLSDDLWTNFIRATESSYASGPGKLYMTYLCKLLGCSRKDSRFESSLSTNAGGCGPVGPKDVQAGSSILTHVFAKCKLRSSSPDETSVSIMNVRRFSDVSTFDHEKKVYNNCSRGS